ncbi:MAG: cytochrome b/b6 domain-containing protein [Proteobacteria bacterium]|nr:cytochrome b/b6 domain-containing protein [Pseudomonadota bacterium]
MNRRETTRVWDPAVRIFHWSLVLTCLGAFISSEESESIHAVAGYVITALILFRIIWGFIGTRHARFIDFIYGPREISSYLKGFLSGRSGHYLGHNPAGGLMVLLLLASLLVTCWTGLKAWGEEGHGPLSAESTISITATAHADSGDKHKKGDHSKEELYEEVHEFFAGFTLFLIVVHIAGVLVTTVFHREHLIKGMITGRKPLK